MIKLSKTLKCLTGIAAILLVWWVSVAAAWTYSVEEYTYTGSPALPGTVPGADYTAKVASITNDTAEAADLTVDLYYGALSGEYQWSPNGGTNWFTISNSDITWTRTVQSGDTVWLRVVLVNGQGHAYHFLSPSPWGEADADYDEAYFWAFPPGAHYYDRNWERDIAGYVAVALP